MKGKIIKPKEKQQKNLIGSILLLILGIVLVTNSNIVVIIAFQIIGIIIILYGVFKLYQYLNLKKQFKIEDNDKLTYAILSIAIGLLIILLASIIEVGLRFILGFYLILTGLSKLTIALEIKDMKQQMARTNLIGGILFLVLGIYTIFVANTALIIIGILFIITAIVDFINYFTNQKKG